MPKRTDIKRILILGAGPIVIGQACEFDYSGAQACKALREEGFFIILINSNPATIMTDPEMADATYIEPIHWETVAKVIEKERPDALLPTMGGQTALNCALDLARHGVLEKWGVHMLGATVDSIEKAENRERFSEAMQSIGLKVPRSRIAHSLEEAHQALEYIGYPAIIRPSFTLGGEGGGIAYNQIEFTDICQRGLELSPTHELLIDQSIIGWKEYEMEIIRDKNDNCIIVCAIENIDPMGIHTGDSITVSPPQTLTDKEYQHMRNAAIAVLREIRIETGGANVQFAVNPDNGELHVIEMNPRVSRSSALASKATGFPIAKIAAKLAVGYTLDELRNEITDNLTPASFEPTLDYIVVKIPRFNFDKFPKTTAKLHTQMASVGEVMAMGRHFQEALQKALRSLEVGTNGFNTKFPIDEKATPLSEAKINEIKSRIQRELSQASWDRLWYIGDAFRYQFSLEEVHKLTKIDFWFLAEIKALIDEEQVVSQQSLSTIDANRLRALKRQGFSDSRLAELLNIPEEDVRQHRKQLGVTPVFKRVDSCAGEFKTNTAYLYSTYDAYCEANPSSRDKIMILGGGPNRIGQGIEFDYCCVHAALALREEGFETIMVNCNPETVSTDYDTSDRLYFEPLTLEHLLDIIAVEQPKGVIVHYGGQTPLKLAKALESAGVSIIGTSPDAIDRAEDRERFTALINELGLKQPAGGIIRTPEEGIRLADVFAYPLVVRPSYVLGGQSMEIIYNQEELRAYMQKNGTMTPDRPLLLDHFIEGAIEVDVDMICDGTQVYLGGILEHIEQAGVHSGDSSCCMPPHDLSQPIQTTVYEQMKQIALKLGVVGLLNGQFAISGDTIYILEINPRASRTIPFISKVMGTPLAKIAALCMVGKSLKEQGYTNEKGPTPPYYAIKQSIFPFNRFPGTDPILGPEMRSTGEVMGIGNSFGEAFGKAHLGGGQALPCEGTAFISVRDVDKPDTITIARQLIDLGFALIATKGTAAALQAAGVACQEVNKVIEGRPHIVDLIKNDKIDFIINTTQGKQAIADSFTIRQSAIQHHVCYTTTLAGSKAACLALQQRQQAVQVNSLQALYKQLEK